MLFTERMKKIEILIMKNDTDSVMRYLGFAGCMQLVAENREQRELTASEREIAELEVKLQSIARFLSIPEEAEGIAASPVPERAQLRERAIGVMEATKGLVEEEGLLVQRRLSLKQTAEELAAFSRLKVAFSNMENLTYLAFRLGSVAPDQLEKLIRRLGNRALLLPLTRPGHFIAVAPKKGRWALDSELAKLDFQAAQFPAGMKGVPADMLLAVQAELAEVERSLQDLERRKRVEAKARAGEMGFLLANLGLDATIDTVKQTLASTGSVQKLTGWIPQRGFKEIAKDLDELTRGRIALRAFDPEELPDVKSGKVKVPVTTRHGRVVRSFDRMVFSYSTPLYGTIDPTPFVAVMFVVLFAIMFGDVGQGFVGVLFGLLINSGKIPSFASYRKKHFGTTFLAAGLASMVSGFFYGSFFANEQVLVPISRFVTQLVVGRPMDHIISLVGFQRILIFFGVTIGVGAIINSIGLLINIVNMARRRLWEEVFLSKTGIAGGVFFWYLLFIAVRMLLGGHLFLIDFVALALPLLALFCRDLIMQLVRGHRPLMKEGLFAFIMGGIAEVLESAIYYISNSVSFLRVAAFALAHTVLSAIIFLMAGMVGGAPGGIALKILVVLIGNSIIIILEGLIVTIQVVRLQYYEFFSKFFNETGEEFAPFILRASGGLR
ncbi:MAG: V-type ATPase 116kDa subunit family protein [Spirochaetia bacterium]|jgi:V/A-type H+-transporting ATPase subunit I